MKLTLPFPPSANRYWRTRVLRSRGQVLVQTYLSPEAKAYKKAVAEVCERAHLEPVDGEVSLVLHVFRPKLVGDLSNRLKVLEDSLNGFAWVDDKQVAEIRMVRDLDRERPRVEVEVLPVEPGLWLEPARLKAEQYTSAREETPAAKLKRMAKPNVRKGGAR